MEKLQSKKPQIRFPEFKDSWEHRKLNELLSEAKKRNEDLKYGKDEVLSVSGELGIVNQIEHLGRSYAGVSVHQYHVVEVGDIVYTKSPLKANPFGIIKLNKGKSGIVSTLYAVYKVNNKTAYGEFLDYYFSLDANTNRYLRPLVKKGAKNDMKINNAYVLHDRIFAPTIPEQKRIAMFFKIMDKKISELKRKKILLEQYKKGIIQKLFSQELRFKDDKGKEFPKWTKKKLGEITTKISDGLHSTPIYDENGEYFFINGNNLIDGKIVINEKTKKVGRSEFLKHKKDLSDSTILLSINGTIGSLALYHGENVILGKSACYINVSKDVDKLFIYNSLQTSEIIELFTAALTGTTIKNLSLTAIKNCAINLPSKEEQIKISNFLSVIDEKMNRTQNQIQQTEKYKIGLLQNMFC